MPIKRHLPLISFQPIANSSQEWVGIAVHFAASFGQSLSHQDTSSDTAEQDQNQDARLFLEYLEEFAGFVRLANLTLYIPCNAAVLKNDAVWPVPRAEHICLWLTESLERTEENQSHLHNRLDQGFGLCVVSSPESTWMTATVARVDGRARLTDQLPLPSKWKLVGVKPNPAFTVTTASMNAGSASAKGKIWADHVDSTEVLAQAEALGCTLFSGSYALNLSRNGHVPGSARQDSGRRTVLLRLLTLVSHDADSRALENLLKQDTVLSYQLLKLVSAASYAHAGNITNFAQAIALLGRRQLQRWLQLLLYAKQTETPGINPLLPRAAWRARFMELLCEKTGGGRDEQDCAFMIGMFSLLDILFSVPLPEILKPLNLPPEIFSALLGRNGQLGRLLTLAEYACHDVPGLTKGQLIDIGISTASYYEAAIGAFRWVNQVCQDK